MDLKLLLVLFLPNITDTTGEQGNYSSGGSLDSFAYFNNGEKEKGHYSSGDTMGSFAYFKNGDKKKGIYSPGGALDSFGVEKKGENDSLANISHLTKVYLTSQWMTRLVPSVYTLVICVALPLNVMAIIIFLYKMKVRKPAVVYMLNLATADVLFVILLPFIIIYRFSGNDWLVGEEMCRLVTAAFYCNMYCSILLITSISVDRYLAVVYPIPSLYWRTTTRTWVACIFIWILSISSTVPLLMTRQTYFIEGLNITTCYDLLSFEIQQSFYLYFFTAYMSLLFFFPLFITTFCYIGVIRTLSSSAIDSTANRSRAAVLTVTALCMFVLCFGPTNILFLIHYLGYYTGTSDFLYFAYVICACISSISCCLDPLIYYFGSSKCQRYVHSLLCCKINNG